MARYIPKRFRVSYRPKKPGDDERSAEGAQHAAEAIVRYLVVANAAGAIAILGFMGTAFGKGSLPIYGLIPLGLFLCGLLAVGITLFIHFSWWQAGPLTEEEEREDAEVVKQIRSAEARMERATRREFFATDFLIPGSLIFFVAGIVVGLGMLALL